MADTAEDIVRALALGHEDHEVWKRAVAWVAERDWWPVAGETVECRHDDANGFFKGGERYVVKKNDDGRLTFEGTPAFWFVTHFRRVKKRMVASKDWGIGEVLEELPGNQTGRCAVCGGEVVDDGCVSCGSSQPQEPMKLRVHFAGLDQPVEVYADQVREVEDEPGQ